MARRLSLVLGVLLYVTGIAVGPTAPSAAMGAGSISSAVGLNSAQASYIGDRTNGSRHATDRPTARRNA
jgi:hypothetical protein